MQFINIRLYENRDFKELVRLYKDTSTYGGNYDEARDTEDRLAQTAEEGNLLVAEAYGKLVGSVMILDNPHSFWLLRFVIDLTVKAGDEIAGRLMEKVDDIATARGHHNVIVYTNPNDDPLNERYKKLNFTQSSDYRCYWKETA